MATARAHVLDSATERPRHQEQAKVGDVQEPRGAVAIAPEQGKQVALGAGHDEDDENNDDNNAAACDAHLVLLGSQPVHISWGGTTRPRVLHSLHARPFIGFVDGVVTRAEALALIAHARPLLARSETTTTLRLGTADHGRTSSSAHVPASHHPVAQAIAEAAGSLLGVRPCFVEDLQVVHYAPGQRYLPHHDWFPSHSPEMAFGQRQHTALVYLTGVGDCKAETRDGKPHSSTHFPRLGLHVMPRVGRLVLWENVDAAGQGSTDTLHQGVSPRTGEKWAVNVWTRSKPVRACE